MPGRRMRRRDFFILSVAGLWIRARDLWADHHVISADPLIITTELGSLRSRYTESRDFYVRNHYPIPGTPSAASLQIEGEVEVAKQLTQDDLGRLAVREIGGVLECAGNPSTSNALVSDGLWTGWKLADVLALARPKASAAFAHLFGSDGYSRSVPFKRAVEDGMLVTQLNGHPLPRNHGAPWRILFPGWYGMDSVKWIEKIVAAQFPLPPQGNAYLELRSDSPAGREPKPLPRIQVKSVITSLADHAVIRRGKVEVRGLAWSGFAKISRVQLSGDAGASWTNAELESGASSYDWAMWHASIELQQVGPVELVCRAFDASGNEQPEHRDSQRVDSYAYNIYNRVRCVVVP